MRGLSQAAEVAVVDNITLDNLDEVLKVQPGVVIVGRAILSADDPAAVAAEFRRRMDGQQLVVAAPALSVLFVA